MKKKHAAKKKLAPRAEAIAPAVAFPIRMKMRTYSGRMLDPLDPSPADILIEDIAHHLSQICRYGGATARFYSVAEHCVLGAEMVGSKHKLAFLLHDAAEYLLGDVVYPIKRLREMSHLRSWDEFVVGPIIAARFGLPAQPMVASSGEIGLVDRRMRWTEMRDLLGLRLTAEQAREAFPWTMPVLCLDPKGMFLDAFERYGGKA